LLLLLLLLLLLHQTKVTVKRAPNDPVGAVPVFMSIQGSYTVDYRIVVACRDGCVYTIKKGVLSAAVIELPSQAVGLERLNKVIYVGCMDETLSCYSTKGKRLWTLPLPSAITTMRLMHYRPRNIKAVMVALRNCEVRLYQERVRRCTPPLYWCFLFCFDLVFSSFKL